MKRISLLLLVSALFGCGSIVPNARDATPFRFSPDMEVQGCAVRVYTSVDGKTENGQLYHRIGRVFIFPSPEKWDLAYNPRFSMLTSALTGLTGRNWVGEKDTVMATVLPAQGGWRGFVFPELKPGARFIPTRIVGQDPKEVAIRMAVLLQTGRDLSACPSVRLE